MTNYDNWKSMHYAVPSKQMVVQSIDGVKGIRITINFPPIHGHMYDHNYKPSISITLSLSVANTSHGVYLTPDGVRLANID